MHLLPGSRQALPLRHRRARLLAAHASHGDQSRLVAHKSRHDRGARRSRRIARGDRGGSRRRGRGRGRRGRRAARRSVRGRARRRRRRRRHRHGEGRHRTGRAGPVRAQADATHEGRDVVDGGVRPSGIAEDVPPHEIDTEIHGDMVPPRTVRDDGRVRRDTARWGGWWRRRRGRPPRRGAHGRDRGRAGVRASGDQAFLRGQGPPRRSGTSTRIDVHGRVSRLAEVRGGSRFLVRRVRHRQRRTHESPMRHGIGGRGTPLLHSELRDDIRNERSDDENVPRSRTRLGSESHTRERARRTHVGVLDDGRTGGECGPPDRSIRRH